jgi:phage regulator Rha-like protein
LADGFDVSIAEHFGQQHNNINTFITAKFISSNYGSFISAIKQTICTYVD